MKTIEERADEFVAIVTKGLEGFNLETQTELIKQCYLAGAEDSHKWHTFEEEIPPKNIMINTMDKLGNIGSIVFKSGDIKLLSSRFLFAKWKPINIV